jgi:Raf kinase inhibitor-like YbhB/YbcL family protein
VSCKPALLSAIAIAIAGCGGSTSASSTTHSTSSASATSISSAATANAATATPPAGVRPGARLASGFHLSSPAFRAGGAIPRAYTCDGRGSSLPLRWTGAPRGAKELVLVMRDPDAPGGTLVHWAVAGIPPTTRGFPAGGVTGQIIPGRGSFGSLEYRGPCPPRGARAHHYVLTLVALSGRSGLRPGFTPDQLQARALAIATLIGTYARSSG